jgi:hypothetical protein
MLGQRSFRHEHGLDDEGWRDCNPRYHGKGGKYPRLPAQRQNCEAHRGQSERGGELAGEREVPGAAAVSKTAESAAGAH